ncbi:MAG: hypothetical protein RLY57_21 [Candidatus Parcubacteria bacterium]|jgi:hypothetical protein
MQSISKISLFTTLGLLIGFTGGISFSRTHWINYDIDFFFWWSIISTLIGFLFVIFSVWQYWVGKNQEEKNKAQVKIWMQDANGISSALQRIVKDNLDGRYSSTNDMANSIWSVEAMSKSFYQSLYEERCVTEEEYKIRQKRLSDLIDKQQEAELAAKISQTEIK